MQYPVNIKNANPRLAKVIISQLGGPDGELGASLRYMCQRYAMPQAKVKGLLTDISTEELAHIEIVSAILYQLTKDLTPEQIKESGFDSYFVDHTTGIYPQGASGVPFTAAYLQSTGDPITDLTEDLAAEQKARDVSPEPIIPDTCKHNYDLDKVVREEFRNMPIGRDFIKVTYYYVCTKCGDTKTEVETYDA